MRAKSSRIRRNCPTFSNSFSLCPPKTFDFPKRLYDTRGDGRVGADQLGQCLRSLGLCPSESQLAQLLTVRTAQEQSGADAERISVEQFVPMLRALRAQGAGDRTEAELAAFLENLDRDGQVDGMGQQNPSIFSVHPFSSCSVGIADLRHFLTHFGEPLTEEDFEQLVAATGASRDPEGRLGIAELVQTLLMSAGNK